MPIVTFPCGNKLKYDSKIQILDIVNNVNFVPYENCVTFKINGKLSDITDYIEKDSFLEFILLENDESIKIIRNSCVYLLGYAIKKRWPTSKMATYSITENGFYYDIDLDYSINVNDLLFLEQYINTFINKKRLISKKTVTWQNAYNIFNERKESYKIQVLKKNISKDTLINLYFCKNYVDMCFSPLVSDINFCNYFKLEKISGAYWQNNSNNKMLQRIHGVCYKNRKELNNYLLKIAEINKRDHRKLGKQCNLFHVQEEAAGSVFWHNNGWIIFQELKNLIRHKLKKYNYQEVKSPLILDQNLWKKTGHWENYKDSMFTIVSENRNFCIKPMNCPGHAQIFKQNIKSYRDLPIRMAEFGSCHRNESSGSLHGLMRLRNFTQDDAHIFCTEKQISNEVNHCIHTIYDIYKIFGFKKIDVKLSTRPKKHIGDIDVWNKSEKILADLLKKNDIDFQYQIGEGAFYGPKIEFILHDCLNREWQCGTIQLDFSLSKNLNITYINEKNCREKPIIIHRAILGSIERFIGILIEEFAGFLPTWISPVQAVLININSNQIEYVKNLKKKLCLQYPKLRIKTDLRNEKIGFKIREYILLRVPYLLFFGEKEIKNKTVTVRTYRGKNLGSINIDLFISQLMQEISDRNIS
ncbi:threonine--tRNA ligase [Candidatus Tachikawaea gelatinosa]|uniref:Threonine--tRNA ligase n=1 Tax=Candidatus Tachikawaea gelatinosa TaxID=1410383 RepID=A0A090ALJ7_9ENTR|nr:threonine--tRNA ligase [Candidatus Tachikawaea gelatinosa]BAP58519.1 threonine--tRNA ligase [Candidatus Tachikawaea gelatinosa]